MTEVQSIPSNLGDADLARGAALKLLAVRSRSVAEMRQRLGRRFQRDVIELTVSRLVQEGLLNDAKFAEQWRQSREKRRPRSRGMIERELRQRGVSGEIATNALEGFDSLDAAYRVASRYAARQAGYDRAAFDRRVGAFLARRGFEPGILRQTLARLREELQIGSRRDAGLEE